MRVTAARLVFVGLLLAFLGGQAERAMRGRHPDILTGLGIVGDSIAVLIVASLVLLVSYLRTDHFIPGHAKPPVIPELPPIPGPLEYSAEITQLGDGVKAGPSIALVEPDNDNEVMTLPGAGGMQSAHIELTGKGTGGNSDG